jgi:hypothetical protein
MNDIDYVQVSSDPDTCIVIPPPCVRPLPQNPTEDGNPCSPRIHRREWGRFKDVHIRTPSNPFRPVLGSILDRREAQCDEFAISSITGSCRFEPLSILAKRSLIPLNVSSRRSHVQLDQDGLDQICTSRGVHYIRVGM